MTAVTQFRILTDTTKACEGITSVCFSHHQTRATENVTINCYDNQVDTKLTVLFKIDTKAKKIRAKNKVTSDMSPTITFTITGKNMFILLS